MSNSNISDADIVDAPGQGHEEGQANGGQPAGQNPQQAQQQQTSAPSPEGSTDYGENEDPTSARQNNDLPDREERQALGKLQQAQQEAKQAREQLNQYQKQFGNIVQQASRTPDTYKQALMTMRGWSEQEAQAYVERIKAAGQAPESWYSYGEQGRQQAVQNAQQGQPNQAPDPYALTQRAIADYEARQQQKEYLHEVSDYFFEQVPEMNPKAIKQEQRQTKAALMDAVQYEAQRRASADNTVDFKQELVNVYKEMTGRTSEDLEQMRENARLEGYLESNASNASASAPTKGSAPQHSKHGLTPDQMRQAKDEGLSYERFAELIKSNETTVG